MQSLLRISMLVICAAVGIGLAISLAISTTPDDSIGPAGLVARWLPKVELPEKNLVAEPAEAKPTSIPERAAESAPVAMPIVMAPAPPVYAPHYGPVAHQIEAFEKAIDKLQAATERNGNVVAEVLQELKQAPPVVQPILDPLPAPTAPELEELAPKRGISHVLPGEGDNTLVLDVQESDLRTVLQQISAQAKLNILTSKSVTGKVSAALTNVDVFTALDAVLKSTGFVARREGDFIYVGTPEDLQDMDRAQDTIATRVYRPNYVRAADLQQLITPMLTQNIGRVSVSAASEVDIPADIVKTGGNNFAGSDVVIVRDYEMMLRQVDQLVADIDVQPQQVSIEAMILSVKLDDETQFGVDFALLRDQNNVRLVSGSPLANLAQFNLTGDGLRFGFLDASTAVFLNALESIGETNVVASPRILCLNKQRAEILIGSQLGYVNTTVTENASTQSISFLEVGTQLRIRPYIYSDGSIRLEVHPELSTGKVEVKEGFTLPDKDTTQVTTNVMCHDGSTMIIGGLIREDLTNSTTQIPFLGSLPYIGPAFRQKTASNSRHEIIVLITPRLVSNPMLASEGKQAQREYAVRQANNLDKLSPIASRHYGRHYLRLAYAARNAGDIRVALRYANLAVHFDPTSLEASNVRSEVAALQPGFDNNLHNYLKDGLRPWQHPVRDYTKQGYPWSPGNPPEGEEEFYNVYDPGVPGRSFTIDPGTPPQRKLATP